MKLIVLIVAAILVVAGATAYFVLANANGLWPFAGDDSVATKDEPTLKIEKVKLSGEKGKEVLDIKLKLTSEDTGYCVLTMMSKTAGLTIDDSKTKKDTKDAALLKDCQGWSLGTAGLPNGDYKLDVKFVGEKTKLSASDKVTLEGRAKPADTSNIEDQ